MATHKTKTAPKFLRALYDMLHYEDPDILAWSHDGAFFQVFDVHRLEREVLTKYFKHNKFTSLQRQLNSFGFHKWTKTRANVCTFSHDVLRRCHPCELSELVQRTKVTRVSSASMVAVSVGGKRPRDECETAFSSVEKKQRAAAIDGESAGPFVAVLEEAMLLHLDEDLSLDLELVLDCETAMDDDASLLFDGLADSQLLDLDWDSVSAVVASVDAAVEEFDVPTDLLMLSDDDVSLLLAESEPELQCGGGISNAMLFVLLISASRP